MQELDDKIKRMSIKEFIEFGFLQEVNRKFFHPFGLALCLHVDREDSEAVETVCSIWDSRDDPEGYLFGSPDPGKARRVAELWEQKARARLDGLGFVYQPIP